MDRLDEQRLIKDAAAGDQKSAGALIKAHQHSLYAYLLRLSGRPEVAEDVAQEAFVRVLTNLNRFDDRFRFSTWLFTIARRLFLNQREKLHPAYDTDLVGASEGVMTRPERLVAREETECMARDTLQQGLMGLSLEQREVLILFHQHEWPIWLIAQHLTMPQGTVKSHLHRGRKRLREVLDNSQTLSRRAQEVIS